MERGLHKSVFECHARSQVIVSPWVRFAEALQSPRDQHLAGDTADYVHARALDGDPATAVPNHWHPQMQRSESRKHSAQEYSRSRVKKGRG